jgi:hypothetical protein
VSVLVENNVVWMVLMAAVVHFPDEWRDGGASEALTTP